MVDYKFRQYVLMAGWLLAAAMTCSPAIAHVVLVDPMPRTNDSDLTEWPCGGKSAGDPVAVYQAGSEIKVTFDLVRAHTSTTSLYISFDDFATSTQLGTIQAASSGMWAMNAQLPSEAVGPATLQLVHQNYYSCADVTIEEASDFVINAGLNDAWYNPETDGQGFFITVFPELGVVSMAWFTYDTQLPPQDAVAELGDAGHRWMTALGPIEGNQVMMDIEMTSGGLFDTPSEIQRTDPPGSDGTIILTFTSCDSGVVEYDIPSIDRQGSIPIQRVANDNIDLCKALGPD